MVVAHCYLTVPKENRDAYYQDHLALVGMPTRLERGCQQYDYFFPADRDDQLIILERWDCQEDMDAHLANDHCKNSPILREKYGVVSLLENTKSASLYNGCMYD